MACGHSALPGPLLPPPEGSSEWTPRQALASGGQAGRGPAITPAARTCSELPGKEGGRLIRDVAHEKRGWRTAVQDGWRDPPLAHPVLVDICVRTRTALAAMLKPVIDGLEAFVGRDPRGRLEFSPSDDRVMWLRIVRVVDGPALRVRAGRMERSS
jgi:hypothetical protein